VSFLQLSFLWFFLGRNWQCLGLWGAIWKTLRTAATPPCGKILSTKIQRVLDTAASRTTQTKLNDYFTWTQCRYSTTVCSVLHVNATARVFKSLFVLLIRVFAKTRYNYRQSWSKNTFSSCYALAQARNQGRHFPSSPKISEHCIGIVTFAETFKE